MLAAVSRCFDEQLYTSAGSGSGLHTAVRDCCPCTPSSSASAGSETTTTASFTSASGSTGSPAPSNSSPPTDTDEVLDDDFDEHVVDDDDNDYSCCSSAAAAEVEVRRQLLERLAVDLLSQALSDRHYEPTECRLLGELLARRLLRRIQSADSATPPAAAAAAATPRDPRPSLTVSHKYVVLVSVGSSAERPAVQFGSQGLFDPTADLLVTARYANSSLYGLATIFAVQYWC